MCEYEDERLKTVSSNLKALFVLRLFLCNERVGGGNVGAGRRYITVGRRHRIYTPRFCLDVIRFRGRLEQGTTHSAYTRHVESGINMFVMVLKFLMPFLPSITPPHDVVCGYVADRV